MKKIIFCIVFFLTIIISYGASYAQDPIYTLYGELKDDGQYKQVILLGNSGDAHNGMMYAGDNDKLSGTPWRWRTSLGLNAERSASLNQTLTLVPVIGKSSTYKIRYPDYAYIKVEGSGFTGYTLFTDNYTHNTTEWKFEKQEGSLDNIDIYKIYDANNEKAALRADGINNKLAMNYMDNPLEGWNNWSEFMVFVKKPNNPPQITDIENRKVYAGKDLLMFKVQVTDDGQLGPLTYSLGPGAPSGASITSDGTFTWGPSENQEPGIYTIVIQVSDGEHTSSTSFDINVTKKLMVNFLDWDGKSLLAIDVDYGASLLGSLSVTREGYIFTGWDKDISNITSNLTVTAQYAINEYTVSFDSGGESIIPNQTLDYNTVVSEPENPIRKGYIFSGWYKDSELNRQWDFKTDTVPASDITLYAKWIPRTDIPYTVNHYQENVNGTEYILVETENLTGIADSKVEAEVKDYTGFSVSPDSLSGRIKGDGSLIINVQYKRNSYTIVFKNWDGTDLIRESVKYEGPVPMGAVPGREGYTFIGWSDPVPRFMPANDVTVTAVFINNTQPSISPNTTTFDLSNPADISTTITCNSGNTVTDVVYNSNNLEINNHYTFDGNILTIKEDYISNQNFSENDKVAFEIIFDTGYTVLFTANIVNNYIHSDDASLKDLRVGGTTVIGFDSDLYDYDVKLPKETQSGSLAALVEATANDPKASVTITQASSLPGSATVKVMAENKKDTQTYKVNFTLSKPIGKNLISIIMPNDIIDIVNGREKTAEALGLPSTVTLVTDAGNIQVDVNWDVASSSYDSSNTSEQTFAVRGSVILPDGVLNPNGVLLNISIDVTVNAASVTPIYTITASAGIGGSISPNGGISIIEGGSQTFTIVPSKGYKISSVKVDGIDQGAISSYIFSNVIANHTISAIFIPSDNNSGGSSSSRSKHSINTRIHKAVVSLDGRIESTIRVKVNTDRDSALIELEDFGEKIIDGKEMVDITVESIPGASSYTLDLPTSNLITSQKRGVLNFSTDAGSIIIPDNMLSGISGVEGKKVGITIGQRDKSHLSHNVKTAIGDRPLVQLTLTIDGEQIEWNNPDAPVTVSIPYTPTEEELADPEHITIWYIDGSGNVIEVPSGKYDSDTGMVTFTTSHFSDYAVVFVKKTYEDLDDVTWAKKEIEILASKGILKGISEKEYVPQANITRADFLCFLVRTLGVDAEIEGNFHDITKDAYYYKEIAIAKKLGIANGTGKNKFSPHESIRRQDMMMLTERALRMLSRLEAQGMASDIENFTDKSLIATYAVDSIASLIKEGLIKGDSERINPLGNTTRAEAAVFLYKVYNKE